MQTLTRDNPAYAVQHTNRSWLRLTLLFITIIVLVGASFSWLQWACQEGITLGYPQPQVHINTLPPTIRTRQNVDFSATASGRDLTYTWTFATKQDNNAFSFFNRSLNQNNTVFTGKNINYMFTSIGSYIVTVQVSDAMGQRSSNTQTIQVLPVPPIATFTAQASNSFFGPEVSFNASGSQIDPSTTIESYTWDFGDGSAPETDHYFSGTTHYYRQASTYTIKLVVTDATGQQSQPAIQVVTIPHSTR